MISATELLIGDTEKALRSELASSAKVATDEAFALWLLGSEAYAASIVDLRDAAAARLLTAPSYTDVAILNHRPGLCDVRPVTPHASSQRGGAA